MDFHERLMARAITLAKKGMGNVSPNPMVGAVIVKQNNIIARGYHAEFGALHAEQTAIQSCNRDLLRGSSMYVNLEPCDHYGKTPPCTEAIIQSGIQAVYVGSVDPNPLVSGRGIQHLRNAGIDVSVNILKEKCQELNRGFFMSIKQKRPFVTLKAAHTLDGFIATSTGAARWITGETARKQVHQLRREHDAVLVGINTVLQDDPELTTRHVKGISPRRIILDTQLRIPDQALCINPQEPERTILLCSEHAPKEKMTHFKKRGVQVYQIPQSAHHLSLSAVLKTCHNLGICSILIEGGRSVFTAFVREKRVDRFVGFVAPKYFGTGISVFSDLGIQYPDAAMDFRTLSWKSAGEDICFIGEIA